MKTTIILLLIFSSIYSNAQTVDATIKALPISTAVAAALKTKSDSLKTAYSQIASLKTTLQGKSDSVASLYGMVNNLFQKVNLIVPSDSLKNLFNLSYLLQADVKNLQQKQVLGEAQFDAYVNNQSIITTVLLDSVAKHGLMLQAMQKEDTLWFYYPLQASYDSLNRRKAVQIFQ